MSIRTINFITSHQTYINFTIDDNSNRDILNSLITAIQLLYKKDEVYDNDLDDCKYHDDTFHMLVAANIITINMEKRFFKMTLFGRMLYNNEAFHRPERILKLLVNLEIFYSTIHYEQLPNLLYVPSSYKY